MKTKAKKTHANKKKDRRRHVSKPDMLAGDSGYSYTKIPHHPYAAKYIPNDSRSNLKLALRHSVNVLVDFIDHAVKKSNLYLGMNINEVYDAMYFLSNSQFIDIQQGIIDTVKKYEELIGRTIGISNLNELRTEYAGALKKYFNEIFKIADGVLTSWYMDAHKMRYIDSSPLYLSDTAFTELVAEVVDFCLKLKKKLTDADYKLKSQDTEALNILMDPFTYKYAYVFAKDDIMKKCKNCINYTLMMLYDIRNYVKSMRGE